MHIFNSKQIESPSFGDASVDSLALRVNLLVAGNRVFEPGVNAEWGLLFARSPQEQREFQELQETRRRFAAMRDRAFV